MELYKKRHLGDIIADTVKFISTNFTHLFYNFIIFNGIFIILEMAFSMLSTSMLLDLKIIILSSTIKIIGGIVSLSFFPIYMILYNTKKEFNTQDIFEAYKANLGKIVIYILVGILFMIPLGLVFSLSLMMASYLKFLGIIFLILIPLMLLLITLPLYEYLNTSKGVFECFSYAYTLAFRRFGVVTFSILILYACIIVLYLVILLIFGLLGDLTLTSNEIFKILENFQNFSSNPIIVIILRVIAAVINLTNIIYGIIYFSQKELVDKISENNQIDEIGLGEI